MTACPTTNAAKLNDSPTARLTRANTPVLAAKSRPRRGTADNVTHIRPVGYSALTIITPSTASANSATPMPIRLTDVGSQVCPADRPWWKWLDVAIASRAPIATVGSAGPGQSRPVRRPPLPGSNVALEAGGPVGQATWPNQRGERWHHAHRREAGPCRLLAADTDRLHEGLLKDVRTGGQLVDGSRPPAPVADHGGLVRRQPPKPRHRRSCTRRVRPIPRPVGPARECEPVRSQSRCGPRSTRSENSSSDQPAPADDHQMVGGQGHLAHQVRRSRSSATVCSRSASETRCEASTQLVGSSNS